LQNSRDVDEKSLSQKLARVSAFTITSGMAALTAWPLGSSIAFNNEPTHKFWYFLRGVQDLLPEKNCQEAW